MKACAALGAFKALGDETRLRLTRLLLRHELNVGELVYVLEMGQSRISRHLRILVDSGLLAARRDGLWVFYRARQEGMLDALAGHIRGCGPQEDLVRAREVLDARTLETRRFFNAIAPDWQAMRREVLGGLDVDALIVSRLPFCETMADLGCGPGQLLAAMTAKAGRVIGVDASAAMLDLARKDVRLAGASLRVGELEHLPMADCEAQAAALSLTLHHLSDPPAALREAWRVLAPGATLVVADYVQHGSEVMRERFGDRWLGFDIQEMIQWLGRAGFIPGAPEKQPIKLGLELGIFTAIKPLTEATT